MISATKAVKLTVYLKTNADYVVASKGTYKARWGYFYTHGMTEQKCADALTVACPWATVTEMKNHWAAWPKASYFEVEFTVENPDLARDVVGAWLAENTDYNAATLWEEMNGVHEPLR